MKKPLSSRFGRALGIFVSILFAFLFNLYGQEQKIEWDRLEMVARTYIEYPSSENARIFCFKLPEQPLRGSFPVDRYRRFVEYVFSNLKVLERQISVGDRDAVKLGFRLYNFAGGIYAIALDCIMGDLVRSHPRLFLEELKSSPNSQQIRKIGYPVTQSHFGSEEKRQMAFRYELEMRIKALEAVTDNSLAGLRDTLIAEIREYLAKYHHGSQRSLLGEKEYLVLFMKAVIDIYNEAAMANLFCQRVIKIEKASGTNPFGETFETAIYSTNLYNELMTFNEQTSRTGDTLGNPPLEYVEEYSILMEMEYESQMLYYAATKPSTFIASDMSEEAKRRTYKRSVAGLYDRFSTAYAKLVALMPEISQEVKENTVDLEAIKRRLRQRN